MSDKTKIQWADATWNPVRGCSKVSKGCQFCYAERVSNRFGWDFSNVETVPERLDQPLRWKRPRRIFVNSMSDLFHEAVPWDFIVEVFAVMALAPQHQFLILTKRGDRMREDIETILRTDNLYEAIQNRRGWDFKGPSQEDLTRPLPNVWLGVSAENQEAYDARLEDLLRTPAAVHFVSLEPLLGPINLSLRGTMPKAWGLGYALIADALDWVIVGEESGTKNTARDMQIEWAFDLRFQCQDMAVPFFMKQLCNRGKPEPWEKFPPTLQAREWPEV